jgi:hypothetical protein
VESTVHAADESVSARQAAPNLAQRLIVVSSHESQEGMRLESTWSDSRRVVAHVAQNRGYPDPTQSDSADPPQSGYPVHTEGAGPSLGPNAFRPTASCRPWK